MMNRRFLGAWWGVAWLGAVLVACGAGPVGQAGKGLVLGADDAPRVLRVGPDRPFARPSQAAKAARHGDVIEIDAGIYERDVAVWTKNDLTIRGVGGFAQINADGFHAEGKGIWVIKGKNTTIERIAFSGARVPDGNGAAIRQEGAGLTVRSCRFTDNQNGILTGSNEQSDVVVEFSEFADNGAGDGRTHNLYIGNIRSFTLRGSYSHHARIGHNVKSRAKKNLLLYNRIADEDDGTSSYAVDLPNGGVAVVIGNIIQHGPRAENFTVISYGAEGLRKKGRNALYLVNNTVINQRPGGGRFVSVAQGAELVRLVNNLLLGSGPVLAGARGQLKNNLTLPIESLVKRASLEDLLVPPGEAIGAGIDPGMVEGLSLRPDRQYVHPLKLAPRSTRGPLDVGAFQHRRDSR